MRAHLIEIGPTAIRRLCCGGATVADAEVERAAFESIDDGVALVDRQPVTVGSLWKAMFESVDCRAAGQVTVVRPSWWSAPRVGVVDAAAQALVGHAEVRPRSWLLNRAAPSVEDAVIVEITEDFVVVLGALTAAQARRGEVGVVAEAVAQSILTMVSSAAGTVVIDAPATVRGARTLATTIAAKLSNTAAVAVAVVDDIHLRRLAGELKTRDEKPRSLNRLGVPGRSLRALTSVVLVFGACVGAGVLHRRPAPRATGYSPTALVVEGHVALEVPAQWPMRRVVAGPGSARVEVTSPADPEVALHVTQSRVALPGLDATAEFIKSAIDAAPAGVFVDFDPAGRRAGHPVVTYREVRAGHDIRWTVWVDKAVRISIGCQSRSGRDDAVNPECELAVRSARAWN